MREVMGFRNGTQYDLNRDGGTFRGNPRCSVPPKWTFDHEQSETEWKKDCKLKMRKMKKRGHTKQHNGTLDDLQDITLWTKYLNVALESESVAGRHDL